MQEFKPFKEGKVREVYSQMQKLFSCLWKGRMAIFKKIKTSDTRICTGKSRCNLPAVGGAVWNTD